MTHKNVEIFFKGQNPTTFYFSCEKSMSKHSWRTFKYAAVPLRKLEDLGRKGRMRYAQATTED